MGADFRRIQDMRPGYGYAGIPDPNREVLAPDDAGVYRVDLDTGASELIVSIEKRQGVYQWLSDEKEWKRLPFTLPPGTTLVEEMHSDAGLRFVDVNEDGFDDVLFSNAQRYSLHLFTSIEEGWSREVLAGKRGEEDPAEEIPRGSCLPIALL